MYSLFCIVKKILCQSCQLQEMGGLDSWHVCMSYLRQAENEVCSLVSPVQVFPCQYEDMPQQLLDMVLRGIRDPGSLCLHMLKMEVAAALEAA